MARRLPIIDSHVHFYDRSRPEGVLWPPDNGEYPSRACPDDLFQFAPAQGIVGVVLIETGYRELDDQWLLKLAEQDSRILGVVANLQAAEQGFEKRLEACSRNPKLCGIRLRPIKLFDLNCSRLRTRLLGLSRHSLCLELGATSPEKMSDYIELASALSNVPCGLTHLGHPLIDGKAPEERWAQQIMRFATLPNSYCKLTALREFTYASPPPENPDYYRPVLEFLLETFGEDRIVFGSNWPNGYSGDVYKDGIDLYQRLFKGQDRLLEKLFYHNSRRIYRLECQTEN